MTHNDLRDQFIAQVVAGKTFVDVGGLWGTINEKVSVAHQSGAVSLTMLDICPEDRDLWKKFIERMEDYNITNYRCLSKDISKIEMQDIEQPFDVVHCSGILYHHPAPMTILNALRKITRGNLILTSAITQEIIENQQGCYQIPKSGVIFIPAINDIERNILKAHWESSAGDVVCYGITEKTEYQPDNFAPWWWLPTASALSSMCESVGFKIMDSGLTWNNNALTLLLSV